MTLPTGQIGLSQVNTELGRTSTLQIDLGGTNPATTIRTLAGVASGQIGMNSLRGKSNIVINSHPSLYSTSGTFSGSASSMWDGNMSTAYGCVGSGNMVFNAFGSGNGSNLHIRVRWLGSQRTGVQIVIHISDGVTTTFPIYDTDSKSPTFGQIIAYSSDYYAAFLGTGVSYDFDSRAFFGSVPWVLSSLTMTFYCSAPSGFGNYIYEVSCAAS